MKGIPTSAGSASRRENEFWAGGGHAKASGVPGRCWDLENDRMLAVAREGVLSPLRGWFSWGDETQRSRAGLPSDGPPGLGPRLGGNGDVNVCCPGELSRRGGWRWSLSPREEGGFAGWEQHPFATFCDFCGHPHGIEANGSHAKNRPSTERVFCSNELEVYSASTFCNACAG